MSNRAKQVSRYLTPWMSRRITRAVSQCVTPKRSWHAAWRVALILGLAVLFLGATDSDTRFNTLGHRLMCTCGCGQVLLECNHVGCQSSEQMRTELMAAMQRGGSDDEILNWFVQKYGPVVLSAPTKTGFNRVAWIMPYLALCLGLALTAAVVWVWKSRPKPVAANAAVDQTQIESLRRRVHEETEI
jgi:cytochrome c-type biogenesis protein CcmH/NrfF